MGDLPTELRRALRDFMDANGLNPNSWAKKARITEGTIRNFLNGDSESMTIMSYAKLATAAGAKIGNLVGEAPVEFVDEGDAKLPLQPGVREIGGTEYVAIGRYDAALSAGPGSLIVERPEPQGYAIFESNWLRAVTAAAPDTLAVLRVGGDSMVPTLNDGDWVLVDRSQRKPTREGIYALRVGDDCWIKRLSINLRDKLVRVISDNANYPVQDLPEDELTIIGRVAWVVARRL